MIPATPLPVQPPLGRGVPADRGPAPRRTTSGGRDPGAPLRIVVPAGGTGAARFLRGLLDALAGRPAEVTVIGNTADDVRLLGLHISPDLDTVMYTLGGGIAESQGWGRAAETFNARDELRAYGIAETWFGLGDRDLATHLIRTQMLAAGYPLSAVTAALCDRWQPGVRLLPMSDDRVETHVVIDDPAAPGGRRAVHFQEYWVRLRAEPEALDVVPVGVDAARPGPGVLEAFAEADVVLIPPSNPVVSIGPVLAVPGVRAALVGAAAPVVGVSPVIGGSVVRGMAHRLLPLLGAEVSAAGVGALYGSRRDAAGLPTGGLLDGWLVDDVDADAVDALGAMGLRTVARPLLMTDRAAAASLAGAALDLALELALGIGPRVDPAAGSR